jgi:DNA polymerase III epsilon subunit-like protein
MFNKDLLILDVEATGADFSKYELIQIGAILLDKKSLKEKKSFESFIKPGNWKGRDPEAMAVNKITWNEVKDAPGLRTVLRKFQKTFGTDFIIAPYGTIIDTAYLRLGYKKCRMKYPFDYHVYDIWPLLYTYMAKHKLLKNRSRFSGFKLEDAARHFKIKDEPGRHTALADCRLEAEVLRKVLNSWK